MKIGDEKRVKVKWDNTQYQNTGGFPLEFTVAK